MSSSPDVSIIITSFNTKKLIRNCIESVINHTKAINYELIVVDNASVDGSVVYLSKLSDKGQIKLISLSKNIGYGAGNNRGAAVAVGKYLLFLNSDTLLQEDSISLAYRFLSTHTKAGVYGCQLTSANGHTQSSGGYFPTLWRLFAWQMFIDDLPLIGPMIKSIHPHTQPSQPDWVTGAFMMIPKSIFNQVGGFDEKIFMYVEELELCFRIHNINKTVVYDPGTKIIHFGGGSGGSSLALPSEIKNMVYFFQKHYSSFLSVIIKIIFLIGCLLRWFIFGIIKRDEVALIAYRRAIRQLA